MPNKKNSPIEIRCEGYGSKKGICQNVANFPKVIPYCNNCAGANFESQVAHLFQVQGYKVRQNLSLSGTQHDFFAELIFGFSKISILVECKWKFKSDDKVNSDDVRKFHGSMTVFNTKPVYGKALQAFLVTSGQFAPEAREVAATLNIELFTYQDLINSLVNLDSYWDSLIIEFEKSHLQGHYIDLVASSGKSLLDEVHEKVLEHNALVILGDYGTGKTSFCLNLCHSLARDIKAGKLGLLPFFIQLKDYNKAVTMDSLITNLLVNQCHIANANIYTFRELLKSHDVLLVFDGFDEIAQRVDYTTKYKVFQELCSYAEGNTKILVTCRPNFFNQRDEFLRIFKSSPLHFEPTLSSASLEFQEIEIAPLSESQIKTYIASYKEELNQSGLSYNKFSQILREVHDLWDLAKRPVLLNVMRETIPKLKGNASNTKITAGNLYQIYTDFWLKREDNKGKTYIRAQEKLNFVRKLAKKMFTTGTLVISHSELPREVQEYFTSAKDPLSVEYFTHDIRSCSFLNLDNDGNYKFIHKSFMEFFVAKEIIYTIKSIHKTVAKEKTQMLNELLGATLLSLEIGFFIRDFISNNELKESDLSVLQIQDLEHLTEITCKNLISILQKVGGSIEALITQTKDLSGIDFSNISIEGIRIEGSNFSGAMFNKSSFKNCIFSNCHLENTVFKNTSFSHTDITDCSCISADLSHCALERCNLNNTDFAYSNFNNTIFTQCNFNGTDVSEVKFNDNTHLLMCHNVESALGLPYDMKWSSNIDKLLS